MDQATQLRKGIENKMDFYKSELLKMNFFKTEEGKQLYELTYTELRDIYQSLKSKLNKIDSVVNVKTVAYCKKCHFQGNVVRQKGVFIVLECPGCSQKWETLSASCKSCNKPNGFAVEGYCSTCYSESRSE